MVASECFYTCFTAFCWIWLIIRWPKWNNMPIDTIDSLDSSHQTTHVGECQGIRNSDLCSVLHKSVYYTWDRRTKSIFLCYATEVSRFWKSTDSQPVWAVIWKCHTIKNLVFRLVNKIVSVCHKWNRRHFPDVWPQNWHSNPHKLRSR